MRIDKFLGNMGKGSRSELKKHIAKGGVKVNGVVVKSPKQHIDPAVDTITFYDMPIEYVPYVYLMLNKPAGYLSATEDLSAPTVMDLVPETYRHYDLFPVGRLDKDTLGLLLITNDGKLSHRLLSPVYHVKKTYLVTCEKNVDDKQVQALEKGVCITGGYKTKPAYVTRVDEQKHKITLTITEGKYHQVKLMLKSVGNNVIGLERIAFAGIALDPLLERGKVRLLSPLELECLKGDEVVV